jgi:hypothetical protein
MVAVVAVVVGIVLVLIYRERSRTAGDPPAATTGHSERAADFRPRRLRQSAQLGKHGSDGAGPLIIGGGETRTSANHLASGRFPANLPARGGEDVRSDRSGSGGDDRPWTGAPTRCRTDGRVFRSPVSAI